MRKKRKPKDYWDKYENYSLDSSLDKSNYNKFSLDLLSSDNKRKVVIEDNGKKEGIYKSLEDD